LYVCTHASSWAWASWIEANVLPARNSRRSVLWKRSILPVVVGERGRGQQVLDAVVPAHAVEGHLTWAAAEAIREDLAVEFPIDVKSSRAA
jgi:hypothetical protein